MWYNQIRSDFVLKKSEIGLHGDVYLTRGTSQFLPEMTRRKVVTSGGIIAHFGQFMGA